MYVYVHMYRYMYVCIYIDIHVYTYYVYYVYLVRPLRHSRHRRDDERAPAWPILCARSTPRRGGSGLLEHQRDGLHGLAHAHFVREYAAEDLYVLHIICYM